MLKASFPEEIREIPDLTSSKCGAWHMVGTQQMCVKRSRNEYAFTAGVHDLCEDARTMFLPHL